MKSTWSSAQDGYVIDINSGELIEKDIYHPHSLCPDETGLLFCESCRSAVSQPSGASVMFSEGYTRGLCRYEDWLVVGLSAARRVSKSSGFVNNMADVGSIESGGRLAFIRSTGSLGETKQGTVDFCLELGDLTREIYDVLSLQNVLGSAEEVRVEAVERLSGEDIPSVAVESVTDRESLVLLKRRAEDKVDYLS